ncbi:MAG: (2Fe-2S)-binding protein [Desulfuromonadaceae bacterium]|nr:(2Fe-2S)-binding protein [Desulfuromonadaceae bacterium]MDD5104402.1 (2Fe-2S)-binding protein [Desulfuromonadaceae bacterium]
MKPFTENILEAPPDEIVCWCSFVSKRTVMEAIRAGANDMEAIRHMTGACTIGRCPELSPRKQCCSMEIKKLLAAEHKK